MHFLTKPQISLPKRNPNSKKGDNGKVLIIAGSKDYVGAAALAGLAALRAGSDWVTIAAPEKVAWAINSLSADLVTKKLSGEYFSENHAEEILELAKHYDAVLIGNGIGLKKETKRLIRKIIKIPNLKVIDADAIKIIGKNDLKNSIITPHIKELEYFLRNSKVPEKEIKKIVTEKSPEKRAELIKKSLKEFFENNILLLKGHIDTIISQNKTFYNKTGNPGMTKAGTGDVLAGLCAGFLSQNKNLLQSAINSAYFNGLIGDILLKKKRGYSFIASDMVEEIKKIVNLKDS